MGLPPNAENGLASLDSVGLLPRPLKKPPLLLDPKPEEVPPKIPVLLLLPKADVPPPAFEFCPKTEPDVVAVFELCPNTEPEDELATG